MQLRSKTHERNNGRPDTSNNWTVAASLPLREQAWRLGLRSDRVSADLGDHGTTGTNSQRATERGTARGVAGHQKPNDGTATVSRPP